MHTFGGGTLKPREGTQESSTGRYLGKDAVKKAAVGGAFNRPYISSGGLDTDNTSEESILGRSASTNKKVSQHGILANLRLHLVLHANHLHEIKQIVPALLEPDIIDGLHLLLPRDLGLLLAAIGVDALAALLGHRGTGAQGNLPLRAHLAGSPPSHLDTALDRLGQVQARVRQHLVRHEDGVHGMVHDRQLEGLTPLHPGDKVQEPALGAVKREWVPQNLLDGPLENLLAQLIVALSLLDLVQRNRVRALGARDVADAVARELGQVGPPRGLEPLEELGQEETDILAAEPRILGHLGEEQEAAEGEGLPGLAVVDVAGLLPGLGAADDEVSGAGHDDD
ncbi:hypothetical protein PG996_012334 [Apiospora saccharicola]|uniref:Uncharacterized protein n=1 Tax=Apiospora saccharicola TaxID=335842 RepID=A0ABR1U2J0_9PEZI